MLILTLPAPTPTPTPAPLTPQARRPVLSVIAVFGLMLFRRRPVRTPENTGDWHPAD